MNIKNHKYEQLHLKDDYEGKVEATFISADTNTNKRPSVLYIHGFIDYFFHPHLSAFFNDRGYDFYTLELRKYGHSILPHQHENYCKSVYEYFEEVDISIQKIKEENNSPLVMLGHSTGGLIGCLYMNKGLHKNEVDALILNSPFLEVNAPSFLRNFLKPITKNVSNSNPYACLNGLLTVLYPKSLHKDFEGKWEFDLKLKPIEGFPVYLKWARAIMDAQDELKSESNIHVPVLLMHSSDSFFPFKHSARVMKADIVLNVNHMKDIGPGLGEKITMLEVKDGMHDLFLSAKPVREKALDSMMSWLKMNV